MAKSKYEYVKSFEIDDKIKPCCWIVVSLKCTNFDNIVESHMIDKPNDINFSKLFSATVTDIVQNFQDVQLCYVYHDEIIFIFKKSSTLYQRRKFKLLSYLCSMVSSSFVFKWPLFFEDKDLQLIPIFKGTVYSFPEDQLVRCFFTLKQLDCHKKNLDRLVFYLLIKELKMSSKEAHDLLKNNDEGFKNELLFSKFNINYNNEPKIFKRGSILLRRQVPSRRDDNKSKKKVKVSFEVVTIHEYFHEDKFWKNEFILENETKHLPKLDNLALFEENSKLIPHNWLVARIDGKGFTRFCNEHNFSKPNDLRSLELMNEAAEEVMKHFSDLLLSYGDSDEYSFMFARYRSNLKIKTNELISIIASIFSGSYTFHWTKYFEDETLKLPPSFDSRLVFYPNNSTIRDYLSWRQVDCHINNLYNTCFWSLVQNSHISQKEATEKLRYTFSADKRKILIDDFNLEYDNELEIFRKGTIFYKNNSESSLLVKKHCDIINDKFWNDNPHILGKERGAEVNNCDITPIP